MAQFLFFSGNTQTAWLLFLSKMGKNVFFKVYTNCLVTWSFIVWFLFSANRRAKPTKCRSIQNKQNTDNKSLPLLLSHLWRTHWLYAGDTNNSCLRLWGQPTISYRWDSLLKNIMETLQPQCNDKENFVLKHTRSCQEHEEHNHQKTEHCQLCCYHTDCWSARKQHLQVTCSWMTSLFCTDL